MSTQPAGVCRTFLFLFSQRTDFKLKLWKKSCLFIHQWTHRWRKEHFITISSTLCAFFASATLPAGSAGGLFASTLFYTTFPVHFKTSIRYDCFLMSYKKVMHFKDEKNRWMHMPADCGSTSSLSRPQLCRTTVPYYFFIYMECRQASRTCSKKELGKLVWLYK